MHANANEFYSVLVQTTGVIVAIVAGFLAGGLVTISSKRASIKERLKTNDHEIQIVEKGLVEPRKIIKRLNQSLREGVYGDSEDYHMSIDQHMRRVREGEERIVDLENDKSLQFALLKSTSNPGTEIGTAVLALLVMTVLGIIVPLYFTIATFDDLNSKYEWGVYGAFVTSVAALIVYAWFKYRTSQTRTAGRAEL